MNINKIQDRIISEFESLIGDIANKFKYFRHISLLGNNLQGKDVERTDKELVDGCKPKIWLRSKYLQGKVYYFGDSDSLIYKGILSLFFQVFSGSTPREIINTDLYFMNEINLYHHLPSVRLDEMLHILQRIKAHAIRYQISSIAG